MLTKTDVENILWVCEFLDWKFHVGKEGDRLFLQLQMDGKDSASGEAVRWSGRKWMLSIHMTHSEVVQTAFKAVLTALEHEARERFLYFGRAIYDPHYNADKLWALRGESNSLDERN